MSYFEDLTPYSYHHVRITALNVGWLGKGHDFPQGEISPALLDRLRELVVTKSENRMRGWHRCELCAAQDVEVDTSTQWSGQPVAEWDGKLCGMGDAEIWVTSQEGVTYAAPNMIVHYIEVHHYLPPAVFLDAVGEL